MTYLDANAREPMRPEALAAMDAAARLPGNPSSVHADGRAARRVLEDAREAIAGRHGARVENVIFTSGATESLALAIRSFGLGRRMAIGATEHDAVRASAPGATVLPCDARGVADPGALEAWLSAEKQPALVCLMLANNETGVIQPVEAVRDACRARAALFVVDAAQAAGRLPVRLGDLGADAVAISAQKLGGPPGAGALLLGSDAPALDPLIAGGGQERGRRGGTPALPAIAGFAASVAAARDTDPAIEAWRDLIEARATDAGAIVFGAGAPRLANTTCLALPGVAAHAQVMALDLAGFAVSAGAACSSGRVADSHVLRAMGAGALTGQAIRVSLPWNATAADAAAFADAYEAMAARMIANRAARAA